ncbi:RNA polymerase factor sigma-54 [Longimicrobium sp.]|uniref:RNA polymerase factor sigma-54 n=1 Tax=Longimicrobium sp. TaxID=2029185 RepID=UPI002CA6677F|nr:RNA polymerase factor sigma-54 [Longimicrobium sp.]HSU18037.1 RNA polymerase factor sigma-54 [Longimicrobium sp.]
MKTGLYQGTTLKQEMKINPRLYQAMDLLYMPLLDLQQHLKQELLNNPFLEMVEGDVEETVEERKDEKEQEKDDEIDWEEILLNGFETGGRREEYEEREYYEPVSVDTKELGDHLHDQLTLLRLSERELLLGEEIIGNINDEGYLEAPLEEIVQSLNDFMRDGEGWEGVDPYDLGEAERMLYVIQAFDPPGIGARDLRECILLQLRDCVVQDLVKETGEGEPPIPEVEERLRGSLAYRIVDQYFDQLINHRWSEISKELSITPRDVQDAADEVAKLDPKPGLKYASHGDNYIIPDLIVEKIEGEYLVFLNDTSLPRLKLSRTYRDIAKDKKKFQGENKEFISNKLNSANWMIQAIEQRRQTMLKVMNFIVDRQRDFFDKGVQYLKPLTLREVAEVIDMHESTVSRVTNEKFVQTPRGVFPLKFFFSSGLSTTSGEDVSARGIKAQIEKLVSDEDPAHPLTDQAIVNILKEEGIQIARRTVAKYRDQLGVLSARMRKRV